MVFSTVVLSSSTTDFKDVPTASQFSVPWAVAAAIVRRKASIIKCVEKLEAMNDVAEIIQEIS